MNNKQELLKKLKALADRGINGEKENADKLLKKLMKKYNISEEEINAEEIKLVWITLKNNVEVKICNQILYAYFNDVSLYQYKGHRTRYWLKLTPAQEIELKYILSVYLNAFYEEQDILVSAFIQVNDIFPKDAPVADHSNDTQEDRLRRLKMSSMSQFMERTQIRKSIGDGE